MKKQKAKIFYRVGKGSTAPYEDFKIDYLENKIYEEDITLEERDGSTVIPDPWRASWVYDRYITMNKYNQQTIKDDITGEVMKLVCDFKMVDHIEYLN